MADPLSAIDVGTFIVAIGALAASTTTFVLTYSRNMKSEQMKVVLDIYARILGERNCIHRVAPLYPDTSTDEEKEKWVKEHLESASTVVGLIKYFTYLVDVREIKEKHVLDYYSDYIRTVLHELRVICEWVTNKTNHGNMYLNDDILRLEERWKQRR